MNKIGVSDETGVRFMATPNAVSNAVIDCAFLFDQTQLSFMQEAISVAQEWIARRIESKRSIDAAIDEMNSAKGGIA